MEISLRQFSEADIEVIYHLYNDKELCELANIPHARTVEELLSHGFDGFKDGMKTSNKFDEATHILQTIEIEGQVCGTVSHHVDINNNKIHDFQIILGRDYWHQKIGLKTVQKMVEDWQNRGLKRVRSEVLQGNRSSNNLMRHLGMDEIAVYEEGNQLFVRYELRLS